MTEHCCKREFKTEKINYCCGTGTNECSGNGPMIMSIWYQGQNGLEDYIDDWASCEVNFCPFCGLKSNREYNV
jgi:hypothetical protein